MKRRKQLALLIGLFLVVLYVAYRDTQTPAITPAVSSADERFTPISVQNPALRLDLLDKMKSVEYQGSHRNIFSAMAPPPPPASAPAVPTVVRPAAPAPPSGPPPLTIPATFFGWVADSRNGTRRAFFSQGDDVFVISVGEVLLGRFRLIRVDNFTAELEEISSGRHVTQVMEEPVP